MTMLAARSKPVRAAVLVAAVLTTSVIYVMVSSAATPLQARAAATRIFQVDQLRALGYTGSSEPMGEVQALLQHVQQLQARIEKLEAAHAKDGER